MKKSANITFITLIALNGVLIISYWMAYPRKTQMELVYELPWNFAAIVIISLLFIANNYFTKDE